MKITSFFLKIAAAILSAAAIVCLILANLEKITDSLDYLRSRLSERKCVLCHCGEKDESDEFEDWDA